MVLPWILLLMGIIGRSDCQVNFPTDKPEISNDCTATNGQKGTCYEFRSTEFEDCAFFPTTDTSNSNDAKHLEDNICRNTGKLVFFCCPFDISPQIPEESVTRPSFLPNEDECGISLSNNIIGGKLTSPGEFPWLAGIGNNTDARLPGGGFDPFCAGTLITTQHVLTAAHCFNQISAQSSFVRLGEYDTNTVDDGALDFIVVDVRHELYNQATRKNDISILKLDRSVNFTDTIRPACLPHHLINDTFDGKNLTVAGWGRFEYNSERLSTVPLKASLPVIPVSECQKRYKNANSTVNIGNTQLCAGAEGVDTCNGDSGGPIQYLDINKGRVYVVGATSFGPKLCGRGDLAGVYTRVGNFINWIEEKIKEMS